LSPFGFLPPVLVRKPKGLNKINKLAKVTNTGGRKPKVLNKIDNLAKVTYNGGRKRKGLNKIDKLAKANLFILLSAFGVLPSV
jgi:hypothetical protein